MSSRSGTRDFGVPPPCPVMRDSRRRVASTARRAEPDGSQSPALREVNEIG